MGFYKLELIAQSISYFSLKPLNHIIDHLGNYQLTISAIQHYLPFSLLITIKLRLYKY
jgi:hypothetical protein